MKLTWARVAAVGALALFGNGCHDASHPSSGQDANPQGAADSSNRDSGGQFQIHVVGNHFEGAFGATVQLRGVNRSGAEYACASGDGFFDGPTDDETSVAALATWHINTV